MPSKPSTVTPLSHSRTPEEERRGGEEDIERRRRRKAPRRNCKVWDRETRDQTWRPSAAWAGRQNPSKFWVSLAPAWTGVQGWMDELAWVMTDMGGQDEAIQSELGRALVTWPFPYPSRRPDHAPSAHPMRLWLGSRRMRRARSLDQGPIVGAPSGPDSTSGAPELGSIFGEGLGTSGVVTTDAQTL